MQYIVYVFSIVNALTFKKSKIATWLLLLFLLLLMIFCVESYDLNNYEDMYYHPEHYISTNLAFGWDLLFSNCRKKGISFLAFKAICGIIELLLIYLSFRRTTKYIGFAMALYAIFPFVGTITQIRNSLAAAIVIYSATILLENRKKATLKFIIGIIIATTIHFSTLFYLVFVFVKKRFLKTEVVILITVIVTISLYIFMLFSNNLYIFASHFIRDNRILQYFSSIEKSNLINIVIPTLEQIIGIIILKMGCTICKKNIAIDDTSTSVQQKKGNQAKWSVCNDGKAITLLYKLNILTLLIIPFYVITPTIFRIYKYILPLNYMVMIPASFLSNRKKESNGGGKILNAYSVLVIGYAVAALFTESYTQGGFFELFNSFLLFPIK